MITLINDSAKNHTGKFDLIFTDPPFEMSGSELHNALSCFEFDHLLLIASMHQIIELVKISDLQFCWQMVFDFLTPTKNRSFRQPHIVHANICYFRKKGAKSVFDRRLVKRHDHYTEKKNGYYPSIFHAPKRNMDYKYQKNQNMINDLVGAFNVQTVCDPFAGSGTTGMACLEHGKDCTLIELDAQVFQQTCATFNLLGIDNVHIQQ